MDRTPHDAPLDEMLSRIYDELRRLARRSMAGERVDHTLQATALVNECCAKLIAAEPTVHDRTHLMALAATSMRRILVDHARTHRAEKRGGDRMQVTLDDAMRIKDADSPALLDLDEALTRLAAQDERKARAVELRFFAGMKHQEIAEILGISERSVKRLWSFARAWLKARLE